MSNLSTIEESRCSVSAQKNVDKKTHLTQVCQYFFPSRSYIYFRTFFDPEAKAREYVETVLESDLFYIYIFVD